MNIIIHFQKHYNKTTKQWDRKDYTSIADAMKMEDWDYISLQQGSYQSDKADTYNQLMQLWIEF